MLNPAQLTAIEQEVRTCFIYEDAPEYLITLEQGILSLAGEEGDPTARSLPQWSELLRAAHSLKGGAALSQLRQLSQLAHRIEDVLQALSQELVAEPAIACALLLQSVDEIRQVLSLAAKGDREVVSTALIAELEQFLATHLIDAADNDDRKPVPLGEHDPVRIVLETDFLECLNRAKSQLKTAKSHQVTDILNTLLQECQALAEILNLRWLSERSHLIQSTLAKPPNDLSKQAIAILNDLYSDREQFLSGHAPTATTRVESRPQSQGVQAASPKPSPSAGKPSTDKSAKPNPLKLVSPNAPPVIEPSMRVPLRRLDYLADTVGELLISYERLTLDQQRLAQTSQDLKKRTRQFYQLRDRIQTLYDQLLLPGQSFHQTGIPTYLNSEFDPLEMDRFTDLHSVLQDVQELLIRIEEHNQDIELLTKSAQETGDRLRHHLGDLRSNLTDARMVPFASLAERFRRLVWDLNQRYDKSVRLQVRGGSTLIDRAVLDQLYESLLHLVRNAFDHGIEPTQERLACGKPAEAQILLAASQQGTQVKITITDDGRGINLQRVQQQAQRLGLLPKQPTRKSQLLQVLFMPGFSTTERVGELSGRGVGLDVVKAQLKRLRGAIQVHTAPGKGTQFTLSVPLTLNILPLLLCQSQSDQETARILAIPSVHVLDLLEMPHDAEAEVLQWRDQTIPLIGFDHLLPAASPAVLQSRRNMIQPRSSSPSGTLSRTRSGTAIAIILNVAGKSVALKASQLLSEREMVLKPFDDLVAVPPYLYGCTIMPSGEVVPVLAPDALTQLLERPSAPSKPTTAIAPPLPSAPASHPETTIVVADDSVAARRWLVRSLEQSGYHVIPCRDGQEAWERLLAGTPCSLAILDIEMPRLDGFQVLSQIRQHPKLRELPVAMLTSRMGDRHIQQATKLGANAYFTKPLGIQQLLRSLENLLSGRLG
jgi:type IV pili sensor histidine kinase/response regulator